MNKFLLLFIIISLYLARLIYLRMTNKDPIPLLVSFFIFSIPFNIEKHLTEYNIDSLFGTLGGTIGFNIPIVMSLFLLVIPNKNKSTRLTFHPWILVTSLLILISFFNPLNEHLNSTLVFIWFFFSHIFLFYLFSKKMNRHAILIGMYDGFLVLSALQFFLALCFPLLGLSEVTTLFHESAGEWANRMDTRVGAVGFFTHPGNLALFTLIASSLFLGTYLLQRRRKTSILLLICNTITVILTFSRTSYIGFVIVLLSIYFIYSNKNRNIFTIPSMLKFGIPIIFILGWLIFFSPLSEVFLQTDTNEMYEARTVHWLMALSIFKESPITGVGLNSHLAFLSDNYSIQKTLISSNDFFQENPIHNIHLIMLAETGILGFLIWIYFLLRNIINAKKSLEFKKNEILSITQIGLTMAYLIYGLSGWAPFSKSVLPFFLFIIFFFYYFKEESISSLK